MDRGAKARSGPSRARFRDPYPHPHPNMPNSNSANRSRGRGRACGTGTWGGSWRGSWMLSRGSSRRSRTPSSSCICGSTWRSTTAWPRRRWSGWGVGSSRLRGRCGPCGHPVLEDGGNRPGPARRGTKPCDGATIEDNARVMVVDAAREWDPLRRHLHGARS